MAALLPCEDRQKNESSSAASSSTGSSSDSSDTGGHLEFLVAVSQPEEGEVGAGDELPLEMEL